MPVASRLPRGRHGLSREEVVADQRLRLVVGMAEAAGEGGYVATSVAEVLKRAGVSRETFYEQFGSKLDCFLAALDFVGEVLVGQLATAVGGRGGTIERFERTLGVYLTTLADHPSYARLYLIEVHAAGAEALERRAALQADLVTALAALLGADDDADRFACQMVVAAVASLVTLPLVTGDRAALLALAPPITDHVRRLFEG
jgi:AcrR family transcriptional regulator